MSGDESIKKTPTVKMQLPALSEEGVKKAQETLGITLLFNQEELPKEEIQETENNYKEDYAVRKIEEKINEDGVVLGTLGVENKTAKKIFKGIRTFNDGVRPLFNLAKVPLKAQKALLTLAQEKIAEKDTQDDGKVSLAEKGLNFGIGVNNFIDHLVQPETAEVIVAAGLMIEATASGAAATGITSATTAKTALGGAVIAGGAGVEITRTIKAIKNVINAQNDDEARVAIRETGEGTAGAALFLAGAKPVYKGFKASLKPSSAKAPKVESTNTTEIKAETKSPKVKEQTIDPKVIENAKDLPVEYHKNLTEALNRFAKKYDAEITSVKCYPRNQYETFYHWKNGSMYPNSVEQNIMHIYVDGVKNGVKFRLENRPISKPSESGVASPAAPKDMVKELEFRINDIEVLVAKKANPKVEAYLSKLETSEAKIPQQFREATKKGLELFEKETGAKIESFEYTSNKGKWDCFRTGENGIKITVELETGVKFKTNRLVIDNMKKDPRALSSKDIAGSIKEDIGAEFFPTQENLMAAKKRNSKLPKIKKNQNFTLETKFNEDGELVHLLTDHYRGATIEYKGWSINGKKIAGPRQMKIIDNNGNELILQDKNIQRGLDYIKRYGGAPAQDRQAVMFFEGPHAGLNTSGEYWTYTVNLDDIAVMGR